MLRSFIIIIFCLLILGCKTVAIQQTQQKLTEYPVILGSIGEDKNFVIQQKYNPTTYPIYKKQIKVEFQIVPFNKGTFKAFQKASALQLSKIAVNYIDSLKTKPKFLNVRISDHVAVLENIKSVANQNSQAYIKNKKNVHIVTSVGLALDANAILEVQKADEVFLSNSGLKNYVLKLYTNKKVTKIIRFNEGVVFSYKTSNFCWKQDDKYKVQLIDLTESNKDCPKKSYRSAKRANKAINYYKF